MHQTSTDVEMGHVFAMNRGVMPEQIVLLETMKMDAVSQTFYFIFCYMFMSYKTARVSNVLLVMVAVYFRCFFLYFTVNIMILREIYTSSSKHIVNSIFGEIGL